MRVSTLLKLAAVAVVALGVALVAVVKSIDFNQYKDFLAQQVRGATGRELVIAGPLELQLGLAPSVIASGVTFGNMASGSRTDMATAERIEAKVALFPLLSRRVEVRRLVLVNADLLLETDAKGRANWAFSATEPNTDQPTDGSPPTRFDARKVEIENASVTLRDGRTGKVDRLALAKFVLTPDAGSSGPLGVELAGHYNALPFNVKGVVGGLSALGSGRPWPVQLKGAVDGTTVVADGTVTDPLAGKGFDLKLSAQGEEMAQVLGLAGVSLPPVGPFKASAKLSDKGGVPGLTELDVAVGKRDTALVSAKGTIADLAALGGVELAVTVESDNLAGLSGVAGTDLPSLGPLKLLAAVSKGPDRWTFRDIKATLGGSDLAGELALVPGRRPHLGGRLTATALATADFATPAAKPGEKLVPKPAALPADGRLFPAAPLPVDALRSVDAEIALQVGKLTVGKTEFTDVAVPVTLRNGKLVLAPVTAALAGGRVDADLSLDASGTVPAAAARVTAKRVELGRLLKDAGTDAVSGGLMEAHITLKGTGDSPRALMAALSGDALASVGQGRIANKTVDWAGGDFLFQVLGSLNPLAATDDFTQMDCGVVHFIIKDGIAMADKGIAVETSKVHVVGAGAIDLGTEEIDIGITPRARQGVGLSLGGAVAGLTRVRGTLASPAIGVDELGAARTAASVGAAVATGGLSLLGELLFDKATSDDHPCRTALGKRGKAPPRKKTNGGLIEGLFGR